MDALLTDQLLLRPFEEADAPVVETLASDAAVAKTSNIPHPYPVGGARSWIAAGLEAVAQGERFPFALIRRSDAQLVGCMTLLVAAEHRSAEVAYWIGHPYWGQGYATEAGQAVLTFAFETLQLNRVSGHAMRRNPASTRVMEKLGMAHEGTAPGNLSLGRL
jgi:[ribosomal protein S5]-alanine N-acetyltransferase